VLEVRVIVAREATLSTLGDVALALPPCFVKPRQLKDVERFDMNEFLVSGVDGTI